MAEIITQESTSIKGYDVVHIERSNGRIENHLLVPERNRGLMLDLAYAELEKNVNLAQLDSFINAAIKKFKLDKKTPHIEGAELLLTVKVKDQFSKNRIPSEKIPSEIMVPYVDKNKFMTNEKIPKKIVESCFDDPVWYSNVTAGAFRRFPEVLWTLDDVDEELSEKDAYLEVMYGLQSNYRSSKSTHSELLEAFKSCTIDIAEELTENDFANSAVYFYPDEVMDNLSSRVSFSKSRRFNINKAKAWLDKQNNKNKNPEEIVSVEEVSVPGIGLGWSKIRDQYPDLYQMGLEKSFEVVVDEYDNEEENEES